MNLATAWWATHAALPHMREQGFGRIINIGSGAAHKATPSPGYTAAKHGMVGMTKALAAICGKHGINVNCLCPGWTNTPAIDFEKIARRENQTVEVVRRRAEGESAVRRILEPEELTGAALLLASPDGSGITGQIVCVDGGYRL
jgi:NAD(P)-dependent dehydrogenase (short-subunit alcohol dehydrogenase family)